VSVRRGIGPLSDLRFSKLGISVADGALFAQVRALLGSFLLALWRDRQANALVLTAFALPVVIGAAGLGVHSIGLTLTKRQLQREVDSAALAGAYSLHQGEADSVASAAANRALTQNNLVAGASTTITPGAHTIGSTTYQSALFVQRSVTRDTPFLRLVGRDSVTITASAVAATVPDGDVCALSLIGTGTGITVAGNTNMQLGCGIGANSVGTPSIIGNGNSFSINAIPIVSAGTIEQGVFTNTVLMENHDPIPDPFASSNLEPSSSEVSNGKCKSGNSWNTISVGSNQTLNYTGSTRCFGSISVQGTLTLPSGVYYLANSANNAGLSVGANGVLNCSGCTFVLTSTTPNTSSSFATMSINGGATLNLSATMSGQYEDILFYRDKRAAKASNCCTVVGNSGGSLSGAIYMPNDDLTLIGNSGFSTTCLYMVALTLTFSGNASVNNSCPPPGNPDDWSISTVRLIS
jgi:Flp pilus assembly protein TadG